MNKVKIKEVKQLLTVAASKYVSQKEAEYFAETVVKTHIKKAPRTMPIKSGISDIESWNIDTKIKIYADKPSARGYDFGGAAPALKIKEIHDWLEQAAKKNGIAVVAIKNSAGIHAVQQWTEELANRNMFALASTNGGPMAVIPHNGTRGIFGTNPISFAMPSTEEQPIVIDMATSEIPFFEYMSSFKSGEPMKEGAAVDMDGQPTTDAKKATFGDESSNLRPMGGGHRGYNIVFMLEVMTGALVGSMLSTEMSEDSFIPSEHGGFIISIDLDTFNNSDAFKKSVQEMVEEIRSQTPADGTKVIAPGDNGKKRYEEAIKTGEINLDPELIKKLKALM